VNWLTRILRNLHLPTPTGPRFVPATAADSDSGSISRGGFGAFARVFGFAGVDNYSVAAANYFSRTMP